MNQNEIKEIFDYHFWAFERVWECVCELTDEQFLEPIEYSTGSIRNIVIHMVSANRNWMGRLQGTQLPRNVYEDYTPLTQTKAKWDQARQEFLEDLATLTQEQLEETVNWELPALGLKSSSLRREILLHLANHATDHRAQILAILHYHFHVKTVEQDMIFFMAREDQK